MSHPFPERETKGVCRSTGHTKSAALYTVFRPSSVSWSPLPLAVNRQAYVPKALVWHDFNSWAPVTSVRLYELCNILLQRLALTYQGANTHKRADELAPSAGGDLPKFHNRTGCNCSPADLGTRNSS
jgi:hypothetical protein